MRLFAALPYVAARPFAMHALSGVAVPKPQPSRNTSTSFAPMSIETVFVVVGLACRNATASSSWLPA